MPVIEVARDPEPSQPKTLATPKRSFAEIVTQSNAFPSWIFLSSLLLSQMLEPAIFFSLEEIGASC